MGTVNTELVERDVGAKFDKYDLPDYMKDGYVRWVINGLYPGSFLTGVLKNDLYSAVIKADNRNKYALHDWMMLLQNDTPVGCWGNENNVRDWAERGGLLHELKRPHTTKRPPHNT